MVALGTAVGVGVLVVVHTLVAAVATRYFRIQLETRWGTVVYSLLLIPLLLVISTLVLSGPVGLGGDLGSQELVIVVVIVLPLALGYTIDVFWMPHPDDVELPDTAEK